MIDRTHPLPLSRQAKAVGISRGSLYYLPHPVSAQDLALMRESMNCTWNCRSPAVGCFAIF
jgi:hypothetical protein